MKNYHQISFIVILLISIILVAHLLFTFVTPFMVALIVVSLCQPAHTQIKKKIKNDTLAAGISTFLVLVCLITPLIFFTTALIDQVFSFYKLLYESKSFEIPPKLLDYWHSFFTYLKNLMSQFGINVNNESILTAASQTSQVLGKTFYSAVKSIAANLVSLGFNAFVCLMLTFVFFLSGNSLKKFISELIPWPENEKERLINRFRELSFAIFFGNGLVSFCEGFIGGMLFYFFDIQGAIIWGLFMSIAAFLPLVGASIIVIPAAIYLLATSGAISAILFILLNSIHLTLFEMLIKPKLIGQKSQLHAVLVFLSIIAGIQIYGIFGLFYGPLLVTMFLALAQIYKDHYKEKLIT